jgi:hypothetical protein
MKGYISRKKYLIQIIDRHKNNGYRIKNHITEFSFTRGGFFSVIFMISSSTNPRITDLIDYSSVCYKIAKKSTRLLPPRGLMYGFGCFPVVIIDELDDETRAYIRQLDIPKH